MLQGYRQEKGKSSSSSAQSPLSFEQVCPRWASKIRQGLDEHDVHTLVRDSKYCIVGEAWGYNGRHAGYYIAPLIAGWDGEDNNPMLSSPPSPSLSPNAIRGERKRLIVSHVYHKTKYMCMYIFQEESIGR